MRTYATSAFLLLLCLTLFGVNAVAQGGNGTLTGTVQDNSNALIPGVTLLATNTATGVQTSTLSNEAGAYNIPSLPPGTYRLTASLPGFQTYTYDNVELGTNETKRFNFTLQIANVATTVDVNIDATTLLTTQGANVGEVLTEAKVRDLPLVSGDVLDLVRIMPGVRTTPFGGIFDSFAGLSTSTVNTVRDGLSVTDGRYDNGIFGSTTINPDLVGEIRLILTPVDAELGRGNGQVQITTRSGTNRYTGTAVWNVRNTALNANTWTNNSNVTNGAWDPIPADWFNENQITLTYGGPIIRNKTFFFAQYDKQFRNQRTIVTGTTMTDSARQGIFRYWDGWNNDDSLANFPTSTGTTMASIDTSGNPLAPFRNQGTAGYNAWIAAGGDPNNPYAVSTYTGSLRCFSVFGNTKADGSPFTANDCPGGQIVTPSTPGPWDPNRPVMDPTGFIRKFLDFMPAANYFGTGDGLNTAGIRWMRGNNANQGGFNTTGLQTGQNINADRDQINIKVDHNFSANHKASVGYTYEVSGGADAVGFWPTQYTGETKRRPHVLTSNFTSTLSANLLNEARFGLRITQTSSVAAYENSNQEIRDGAREFLLQGSKSLYSSDTTPLDVLFDPGYDPPGAATGLFRFDGDNAPFETGFGSLGNYNPLYNFADTLRWTRGVHSLRIGGELRITRSNGYNFLPRPIPRLQGGEGNLPPSQTGILGNTDGALGQAGLTQTMRDNGRQLLYFMAGSIGAGDQGYWINSPDDVDTRKWEDYITEGKKYRDQRNKEYALFFQDDWKITRNLTLNLGLRYEFYGVPYLKGGFTSTSIGKGDGLFGVGRASGDNLFSNWLYPGNLFVTGYGSSTVAGNPADATQALLCVSGVQQSSNLPTSNCDSSKLTTLEFVGPDTPNPDKGVRNPDRNNFGPVVGFAWQVPWFGAGKTTVRGGYSITYGSSSANGIALDGILGGAPGATNTASYNVTSLASLFPGQYLDLTDVPSLIPIVPTIAPGDTFRLTQRSGTFTAYDPNWVTPYTQNFNLSVTRNLTNKLTLDVRYVGTRGLKLSDDQNLNEVNIFNNPELFDALEVVRQGGESPLFDQMFAGLNLNQGISSTDSNGVTRTYGPVGTTVNGVLQTGSMHLRRWQRAQLANGNYEAIADSLNGNGPTMPAPGTSGGFQSLPPGFGVTGFPNPGGRLLRNGCDRIANNLTTVQTVTGAIPVRCFPENYLVANPQLDNANYINNTGYSNYHSLQTQVIVRPTYGLSFTGTYTWSKLMELPDSGYTDLRDRAADYRLGTNHLTHDLRFNGTFELPIGPSKLFLGNTSGWVARLLERWQASFIFNGFSGRPTSITAGAQEGGGQVAPQALWSGSNPDVVGPWDVRTGETEWGRVISATAVGGSFFGNPSPFVKVQDPQCRPGGPLDVTDAMGVNLTSTPASFCTLDALADAATGQILLQNPMPGRRGTLGTNTFETRGVWTFDGSVSKTFQISESKSVQLRVDATNILNHPIPNDPTLNINSNNEFGNQTGKSAFQPPRAFRGTLRLAF